MNDMIEIRSVTYARSTLPEDMVFFDGDGEKRIPITFLLYVITMGERRILVDAGCDTMPGFVMEGFITPAQALQNAGIDPKRITDVIVTHSHHDHAQGIHHFENAVIYLVLNVLSGTTVPFFIFFNRNKDLGMPPRKSTQPQYQTHQDHMPQI